MNLSRNNLSGQILRAIGHLKSLDALNLSRNNLLGQIPSSLTQIDHLNTLYLSSNNLSGKIPTGPQLQSRKVVAYLGNPELCGAPLQNCPSEEVPTMLKASRNGHDDQQDNQLITKGFYVSTVVGFIVGF